MVEDQRHHTPDWNKVNDNASTLIYLIHQEVLAPSNAMAEAGRVSPGPEMTEITLILRTDDLERAQPATLQSQEQKKPTKNWWRKIFIKKGVTHE